MKERFDNFLKKFSRMPCDSVAAPSIASIIVGPAILIFIAAVICFYAVRGILRIYRKKKAEKGEE